MRRELVEVVGASVAPTRRGRGRLPLMTPEKRRAAVIEAAIVEFGRQGIAEVSLDTIARAAGTSRRAVYQLFESKGHLFAEAADVEAARFTASLLEAYAIADRQPAGERTRARFAAVFSYASERPHGFRFLLRLRDHPEGRVAEATDAVRAAVVGTLTDQIRVELATIGMPSDAVPDVLAALFLSMAEAAIRFAGDHPQVEPDALIDLLTSFTITGLIGCHPDVLARVDRQCLDRLDPPRHRPALRRSGP